MMSASASDALSTNRSINDEVSSKDSLTQRIIRQDDLVRRPADIEHNDLEKGGRTITPKPKSKRKKVKGIGQTRQSSLSGQPKSSKTGVKKKKIKKKHDKKKAKRGADDPFGIKVCRRQQTKEQEQQESQRIPTRPQHEKAQSVPVYQQPLPFIAPLPPPVQYVGDTPDESSRNKTYVSTPPPTTRQRPGPTPGLQPLEATATPSPPMQTLRPIRSDPTSDRRGTISSIPSSISAPVFTPDLMKEQRTSRIGLASSTRDTKRLPRRRSSAPDHTQHASFMEEIRASLSPVPHSGPGLTISKTPRRPLSGEAARRRERSKQQLQSIQCPSQRAPLYGTLKSPVYVADVESITPLSDPNYIPKRPTLQTRTVQQQMEQLREQQMQELQHHHHHHQQQRQQEEQQLHQQQQSSSSTDQQHSSSSGNWPAPETSFRLTGVWDKSFRTLNNDSGNSSGLISDAPSGVERGSDSSRAGVRPTRNQSENISVPTRRVKENRKQSVPIPLTGAGTSAWVTFPGEEQTQGFVKGSSPTEGGRQRQNVVGPIPLLTPPSPAIDLEEKASPKRRRKAPSKRRKSKVSEVTGDALPKKKSSSSKKSPGSKKSPSTKRKKLRRKSSIDAPLGAPQPPLSVSGIYRGSKIANIPQGTLRPSIKSVATQSSHGSIENEAGPPETSLPEKSQSLVFLRGKLVPSSEAGGRMSAILETPEQVLGSQTRPLHQVSGMSSSSQSTASRPSQGTSSRFDYSGSTQRHKNTVRTPSQDGMLQSSLSSSMLMSSPDASSNDIVLQSMSTPSSSTSSLLLIQHSSGKFSQPQGPPARVPSRISSRRPSRRPSRTPGGSKPSPPPQIPEAVIEEEEITSLSTKLDTTTAKREDIEKTSRISQGPVRVPDPNPYPRELTFCESLKERPGFLMVLACVLAVLVTAVTVTVLLTTRSNNTTARREKEPTASPSPSASPAPSHSPSPTSRVNASQPIKGMTEQEAKRLYLPNERAVAWLTAHDNVSLDVNSDRWLQRYSLVVFYYSSNGPTWRDKGNWMNTEMHECDWDHRVSCRDNGYGDRVVDGIDLSQNWLEGSLPAEIRHLSRLTSLELSNNQLRGSIPAEILHLPILAKLNLKGNYFSSEFPEVVDGNAVLEHLVLSDNDLQVNLDELVVFWGLETLELEGCDVKGTIPSAIGNLPRLEVLNLQGSRLQGSLPTEMGELRKLKELRCASNHVTGTIPTEICNMHDLGKFGGLQNWISESHTPPPKSCSMLQITTFMDRSPLRSHRCRLSKNWLLEATRWKEAFQSNYATK